MGFSRVVAKHYEGLTAEHRLEIALEELKAAFDQLPVFDSDAELQQRLANDLEFDSKIASRILEKADKICDLTLVSTRYRPTKQIQPRLEILRYDLSLDQQKDLLEAAYQKGIILEFTFYRSKLNIGESLPKVPGARLDPKQYGQQTIEKMQQGFKLTADFLEKCLAGQDSDDIDIEQINTQLYALGYKFLERDDTQHVLNPTIYMESEDTLVIRGNCSEIDESSMAMAIERLAPHVANIKIEKRGLQFVGDLLLFDQDDWQAFQQELNKYSPGKFTFVDRLDNMPGLWQTTTVYQEPGLKEMWKEAKEDVARENAKKTDQTEASEAAAT